MKRHFFFFIFLQICCLQAFPQLKLLSINGASECCPYPLGGGPYKYTVKGVEDVISITWVAENGWILNPDGKWSKAFTTSPSGRLHEVTVRWDNVNALGAAQLKISTLSSKYAIEGPLNLTLRTLKGILPSPITVSNFSFSNNVVKIPLGTTGSMGCSVQNMTYFKPGEIITDFIWKTPDKAMELKTKNSVSIAIGVDNFHNANVSVKPFYTTECGDVIGEARSFTIIRTGPPIVGTQNIEQYKEYSYSINDSRIHSISWAGDNIKVINGQGNSTVTIAPLKSGTTRLRVSYKYGSNSETFTSDILLTVAKTSIKLVGPDVICDSGIFTIDNFPVGATVDWVVSDGLFSALKQTISSITLDNLASPGGSSIFATLTATVYLSNNNSVVFSKQVTFNASGIQEDNHSIYGSLSEYGGECGLSPVPDGASDFQWSIDNNWSVDMQGYYFTTFSSYTPFNGTVWVTVDFANDCGGRTVVYNSFEVGTGNYSLYPNPASTNIEISSTNVSTHSANKSNNISKVRIFSQMGVIVLEKNYSVGTNKVSLNVSSLVEGNYVVHIYNGKEWRQQKLMICK